MGPRRLPPIATPASNKYTALSICTSVGFRSLEISTYIEAAQRLRPDIVIGVADIESTGIKPGLKRMDKMNERTVAWMRGLQSGMIDAKSNGSNNMSTLFAPILPIEPETQRFYLEHLENQPPSTYSGTAIYDNASINSIPSSLSSLPCLSFDQPSTPHDILTSISLGIDLVTIPFLTTASEAGIALSFTFPAPPLDSSTTLPLGSDLWSSTFASSLTPLSSNCHCYTCANHHAAYINHLLNAKEMLAWTLLQLHNHAILDAFFAGVRHSISKGTFEEDIKDFRRRYEQLLPEHKGTGPRVRGYHVVSAKGIEKTPKRNAKAYKKLGGPVEGLVGAGIISSTDVLATGVERIGVEKGDERMVDDVTGKVAESMEVKGLGEEGFGTLYDEVK